jgi:hypothetical protein
MVTRTGTNTEIKWEHKIEREIATKCLEDQPGAMRENAIGGNRC